MAAELFTIPKTVPFSTTGALLSGAKAKFFISGTTTLQNTFTDETLATPHANPVVADGNGVFPAIYLDDTLNYKVDITDSLDVSLPGYPINNLATAFSLVADLASNANALGASLIGIEDAAGNFTATEVEAALAEIFSDLASTANSLGASLVGVEDSADNFTATTVEDILAELAFQNESIAFVSWFTDITFKDILIDVSLKASTKYGFELSFELNTNATPDFQFRLHTPDTLTLNASHQAILMVIDDVAGVGQGLNIQGALESTYIINGSAGSQFCFLRGTLDVNAAGKFNIQGRQNTSDASTTAITQGGFFSIQQIKFP